MSKLFAEQSACIDAPASIVWKVLTNPDITTEWIKEFSSEFSLLDSDWKLGSPVIWRDANGKPDVEGKVTAVEPYKKLRFTVMPVGESPDWEIKEDDGITYILAEENAQTTLTVLQGDFGLKPEHLQYYEATVEIWRKVLPHIKNLSEWIYRLESEGYKDLRVCPIPGPDPDAGEHTHDVQTVHIILNGELTITDHNGSNTFKSGDKVEFPAETTHKAQGSSANGSMLVGVKDSEKME